MFARLGGSPRVWLCLHGWVVIRRGFGYVCAVGGPKPYERRGFGDLLFLDGSPGVWLCLHGWVVPRGFGYVCTVGWLFAEGLAMFARLVAPNHMSAEVSVICCLVGWFPEGLAMFARLGGSPRLWLCLHGWVVIRRGFGYVCAVGGPKPYERRGFGDLLFLDGSPGVWLCLHGWVVPRGFGYVCTVGWLFAEGLAMFARLVAPNHMSAEVSVICCFWVVPQRVWLCLHGWVVPRGFGYVCTVGWLFAEGLAMFARLVAPNHMSAEVSVICCFWMVPQGFGYVCTVGWFPEALAMFARLGGYSPRVWLCLRGWWPQTI